MHELGVARAIVEIAAERCEGRRVTRVVVAIGKRTAVLPDAVRFCFEAASEGTPVQGASLEIVEIDAVGRCCACGATVKVDGPFGECECGGMVVDVASGNELCVREMEVL